MSISDVRKNFIQKNVPYVVPFFSIDYKNDNTLLEWINGTDTDLNSFYDPYFREQKNNLRLFLNLGINPNYTSPIAFIFLQQGIVQNDLDDTNINELYLLVMEQVTTIVANELTAQVIPNNDDYKDKIAAKFVKQWLDSMSYEMDIDVRRIQWEIQKKIFGEAYVVPEWDPDKGPIHPMAKEIEEDEIDFYDEDGKRVKDNNGEYVKISKYQRIGDINLNNPLPWDVMVDPKNCYRDSDWFYWIEYAHPEDLEKKYEKYKRKNGEGSKNFDGRFGTLKKGSQYVRVFHFYHRSTANLPKGRKIICTKEEVLLNTDLMEEPTIIDSMKLPLVRFIDLDYGHGVRGVPILPRNTNSPINVYNDITNQVRDNLKAESPKVLVHETAGLDTQEMPDGIFVMEWRGQVKPSIETPTTNTSSIFKFREDIKKNIIELGGQTPMVRGDTPNAQLDSFIALQHFEDQRVQLAAPDIKNHINSMEWLYRFMIMIANDHYDPDDQRLIKIVGKNNKYNLKFFDPENLSKVYDVKISTTGNLANSKAARTQLMMTIKREFPDLLSNEVFVDMMGLSSNEKFQNAITAAVNSAEMENEMMLNGEPVAPPERYEDLITHWDMHRIPLQSQEYKLAPPEIKMLFEAHMTATEKLMFDQAAESPTFSSRLATLRQFPMFFSPVPVNESPQEEEQAYESAEPPPSSTQEIRVEREPELPPEELPQAQEGAPPTQEMENAIQ